MNLDDLIQRSSPPIPWTEGENIPWNEPDFSRRMLKEHLSQEHDAASRRFDLIDRQAEWIHSHILQDKPTLILDLACGPGLYSERLARLGHVCYGIDYSPASIEYAKGVGGGEHLACNYVLGDIRYTEYPKQVGLVMLIYGEFNVFRVEDAKLILSKAWHALAPGGWLLIEPHSYNAVKELGERPKSWYSSPSGLFSDRHHIVLQENFWEEASQAATMRYYVVDSSSGKVDRYAQSMQAYRDDQYLSLLKQAGFDEVKILPGLCAESSPYGLIAFLGRKPFSA